MTYSAKFLLLTSVLSFSNDRKAYKQELAGSLPQFYVPPTAFNPLQTTNLGKSAQQFDGPALRVKAQAWAENNFALNEGESIKISTANLDSKTGLYHCSMVKVHQGLEIVNSNAQLTLTKDGQVLSEGNSWVKTDGSLNLVKRGEGVSCEQGLKNIATSLKFSPDSSTWKSTTDQDGLTLITGVDFAIADVRCEEKLYQTASGLKHVLDITVPSAVQYLNLMVDRDSGAILGAADWSSNFRYTPTGRLAKRQTGQEFKYRVLQLGAIDPKTVKPSLIINPADLNASPEGWHLDGRSETIGNNVIATENLAGVANAARVAANGKQAKVANFNFDFSFDDTKEDPKQYTDASIVNAFFVTNRFHDIMHGYGFDEAAGNFQKNNFGKGGRENDEILAITQDAEGFNNANFASPPDGVSGIMRMFIFNQVQPNRDGTMENAIVIHELAHGLTNRLTGGAASANCLARAESGGMGEGWSDMYAMALEMESIDTRASVKAVGGYATNNLKSGVRRNPYSTDTKINPTSFATGRQSQQVHDLGEVWASMLFEVYWNMVDKFGFDKDFRRNPQGKGGNNRFLMVVTNGLKLQPCNPTMVQARDAIIKADAALFNGEAECEIITGFAKRGMGLNAANFVNDFTIPAKCQK